jgi:hypothetical protein
MEPVEIAKAFYEAMDKRNTTEMNRFYADSLQFSDPVFPKLNATETKAMWDMLVGRSKSIRIEHTVLESGPKHVIVNWIARYNFSKTGRPVANNITTRMDIENNSIVLQKDTFDLYAWSKQALGIQGYLLGWTSFMQNKIRATAQENLKTFMTAPK